MSRKVYTTVYLTAEQHWRLKVLSEASKVPFSVYIREAIDDWLNLREERLASEEAQLREVGSR